MPAPFRPGDGETYDMGGAAQMRFKITFLHADGDHAAHTVDAAETETLAAWAGRRSGLKCATPPTRTGTRRARSVLLKSSSIR